MPDKTRKRKFFKVYSGPGYPIDPKADGSRVLDAFVNDILDDTVIKEAAPRTYNYERLNKWLLSALN